jgi:hypothetical protein
MQIFKPTTHSTTADAARRLAALFGKKKPPEQAKLHGLGSTFSMSNDMMLGMALGGVAYILMKKRGMIKHGGRAAA